MHFIRYRGKSQALSKKSTLFLLPAFVLIASLLSAPTVQAEEVIPDYTTQPGWIIIEEPTTEPVEEPPPEPDPPEDTSPPNLTITNNGSPFRSILRGDNNEIIIQSDEVANIQFRIYDKSANVVASTSGQDIQSLSFNLNTLGLNSIVYTAEFIASDSANNNTVRTIDFSVANAREQRFLPNTSSGSGSSQQNNTSNISSGENRTLQLSQESDAPEGVRIIDEDETEDENGIVESANTQDNEASPVVQVLKDTSTGFGWYWLVGFAAILGIGYFGYRIRQLDNKTH